jgi:hypothetical protein
LKGGEMLEQIQADFRSVSTKRVNSSFRDAPA